MQKRKPSPLMRLAKDIDRDLLRQHDKLQAKKNPDASATDKQYLNQAASKRERRRLRNLGIKPSYKLESNEEIAKRFNIPAHILFPSNLGKVETVHTERGDLDKMTQKPQSVQDELAEARCIVSNVIIPPAEDGIND